MRVLLAVAWYFPESVGGTEVYVRGLASHLRQAGVELAIATPTERASATSYEHDGVTVFRYPAPYGASGKIDLSRPEPREWGDLLDDFKPTIVDLHSLTSSLELPHLKAARRRGARTVMTVHLPGVICARGTFMRMGTTPCDGDLSRQPCTVCRLEARGVPQAAGRLLAAMPPSVGERAERWALPAAMKSVLTVRLRDRDRRRWLMELAGQSDRVVAPSAWLVAALVRNGIPSDKVTLCRQGVDRAPRAGAERPSRSRAGLRVGFVGRYDPVKGLHVLIDAAARIPSDVALDVHVWGIARSREHDAYQAKMKARAAGNPRVVFHPEAQTTSGPYDEIDVLAVPSLWFETGPIVVLEAQAAGIPVVGSDLGGIAERVTHDVDGWLVPAGDADALAAALIALARDPVRLARLRPQHAVRTTADVARDTLSTYTALNQS